MSHFEEDSYSSSLPRININSITGLNLVCIHLYIYEDYFRFNLVKISNVQVPGSIFAAEEFCPSRLKSPIYFMFGRNIFDYQKNLLPGKYQNHPLGLS